MHPSTDDDRGAFEDFLAADGVRVRRALVARFGVEIGTEACADALAWAWEHRADLAAMANPNGYLYRVGQSSARVYTRWRRRVVLVPVEPVRDAAAAIDDDLLRALTRLPANQRVAVLMVHAHGATYAEVAELLGVSIAAVTNHVHRGVARLRTILEAMQ